MNRQSQCSPAFRTIWDLVLLIVGVALILAGTSQCGALGQAVPPEARWYVSAPGLYIQQTHETDGVAGILTLADGSRVAIAGRFVPTTDPAEPPAPWVTGIGIGGDLAHPGTLEAVYTFGALAGGEGATSFRWLIDGQVVGTERTYTWTAAQGGSTVWLEVTPRSAAGGVGTVANIDAALAEQNPGPDPGPPPTAEWGVPSWWPERIDRQHPRGPGPVNGPQPAAGAYLATASLAGHVARAASWDPLQSHTQAARQWALDVSVAWVERKDPGLLARIASFLARPAPTSAAAARWWLLGGAMIADHAWADLDPALLADARERVFGTLDAQRIGDRPGIGWSDIWEGAPQSCYPDAYVWALIVWYDGSDPRWRTLAAWWGEKWYAEWAPYYWTALVGEDGAASWGQDTYWRSAMGDYLYHAYLALSVATGEDHFLARERGGWYGRLLAMRHRIMPSGQDCGYGNQANHWYNGYFDSPAIGWPHFAALAFSARDAEATWLVRTQKISPITSPTAIASPPWSAFLDPDLPVAPRSEWKASVRFQAYAVARTGWMESDGVAVWSRGDVLCHHTIPQPGYLGFWGKADEPQSVGGWLLFQGRHYGFGSNSVAYDGSYADSGVLMFSPDDQSGTAVRALYVSTTLSLSTLYALGENDGGPRVVQNPWAYRPAQALPFSSGIFEDLLARRVEFNASDPIDWQVVDVNGAHVVAESIEWTPSYTDPGPGVYFREPVSRRPTRGHWIRAIAWIDRPGEHPALVVLDRLSPEPGVSTAIQWRTMRALNPVPDSPGLYHFQRHEDLSSLEGGWPHVLPPRTALVSSNVLRVRGSLWMRTNAPAGEVLGGPMAPFTRATPTGTISLEGVRQYPMTASPALWTDAGPDEHAPWLWLSRLPAGDVALWTVFNSGPVPVAVEPVPHGIRAAGVTVTLDNAGRLTIN